MKILLDTNIVIHREAATITNNAIGLLFKGMDDQGYEKCVHSISLQEIDKVRPESVRQTMAAKLQAYTVINNASTMHDDVARICGLKDINENDINDTILLNELYCGRVDGLLSEDRGIHRKALALGLSNKVTTIDQMLEILAVLNPPLTNYAVPSIQKKNFADVDINASFFDSFREDYPAFNRWFSRKADEIAYVSISNGTVDAFLYLKPETETEAYPDITPVFSAKRRLKIGTLKVSHNGYRLGERFLKIVFDNALQMNVDQIYVTVFDRHERLIELLEEFGFKHHGIKSTGASEEAVYVRNMDRIANVVRPRLTYPYLSNSARVFLVPIYPEYHTSLFPDSILRTESPLDFIEHEPHRNAIAKVYISRSYRRDLKSGDILVFYRTGGYYAGVITTFGIVENVDISATSVKDFIALCRKRSVFSDQELTEHWNYSRSLPFIVNFLYTYSCPKRPNLKKLIELGIIKDVNSAPRGFELISQDQFRLIVKESDTNEHIVVDQA